MPIYPQNRTYESGFYNNKNNSGKDDRVYSAKDIRKPYDVIFSDGIKPTIDGDAGDVLEVSSSGGLGISINAGYAKIGGAWFENKSPYAIILDNPISSTRYDCVIIRNDDSESVRDSNIYIKSLNHIPTVNDLTRNDDIYEICIAYVVVKSGAVSISNSDIVDTRTEGTLCNVMNGVGATVIRTYRSTYFSETLNQTSIPIGITQYDRTRDVLTVYIEGRAMTLNTNYTITNNDYISLVIGLPVLNTKVEFEVKKNLNGATNGTVSQEVSVLIGDVALINQKVAHDYYCNSLTDNSIISNIVKEYQSSDVEANIRLRIHGTFGVTAPVGNHTGASSDPYTWFDFSHVGDLKTNVIIDFSDCSAVEINVPNNSYNEIFIGNKIYIEGLKLRVENQTAAIHVTSIENGGFNATNCRFNITGGKTLTYLARSGTFTNCYGNVKTYVDEGYCFHTKGMLRIIGGEYYSYALSTGIVVTNNQSNSFAIMYCVNCPKLDVSGLKQTYFAHTNDESKITSLSTITSLTSGSVTELYTVRMDFPNMM